MTIEVDDLHKRFGAFQALDHVNLKVKSGELVALLGPSGSGKTTLLRVIAGLEQPDGGRVLIDGVDATARRAQDRGVGFVFQHYALFRHMTIFENIAFGLRVRPRSERLSTREITSRVRKLLDLVQLDWLADHYPSQLSGGQRQRIALARALAIEPKILLLDEPFGALDARVRRELRRWMRRLHDEINLTSLFVTHDQTEALELADRIVVVNHGRIEQVGTPEEVYDQPASAFVYEFLGAANRFHGRVRRGIAEIEGGALDAPEYAEAGDESAIAFVRPYDIEVESTAEGGGLRARLNHAVRLGPVMRLDCTAARTGLTIEVELSRQRFEELALRTGDDVFLSVRRGRVFLSERSAGAPAEPSLGAAI